MRRLALVLVLAAVGPRSAWAALNGSPALGVGDAQDPQELPFAMVDDGEAPAKRLRKASTRARAAALTARARARAARAARTAGARARAAFRFF
jgi:hypothetical protein